MNKNRKRCHGIWSNGKKTFDLDNLNSTAEMQSIYACCLGANDNNDFYYVTEKGTIVHTYILSELEDYFVDTGAVYSRKNYYEILGRNFKMIRDNGEINQEYQDYMNHYAKE